MIPDSVYVMTVVSSLPAKPNSGAVTPKVDQIIISAGSDSQGENLALNAFLIESCELNHVDPQAYLPEELARIVTNHHMTKIDELLSTLQKETTTFSLAAQQRPRLKAQSGDGFPVPYPAEGSCTIRLGCGAGKRVNTRTFRFAPDRAQF